MGSSRYFYGPSGSDNPVGPVSLVELQSLADRGEIRRETPVIEEGADKWRTWGDYAGSGAAAPEITRRRPGPVSGSAPSGVDRFLALNFRFGKVIAVVIGAFFLIVFVVSLIYATLASGDSVKAPTFEDFRPKPQSGTSAARNFTDLDESRAVEKKYGDDLSDIIKTFGLRSSDYERIKEMVVDLPEKYRRQYIKGLRRVLEDRNEFVKKNGEQAIAESSDLAKQYSVSFAQAVANAAQGEADAKIARRIAMGVAAASCLAAFIMMTIPAILMIEQNTRKIVGHNSAETRPAESSQTML